jgi:hypothetical protein
LTQQDKLEFKKIRAAVLAEKAETIGYGLILLYPETFIDALKDLAEPASLAQPHEFRAKLVNLAPKLRVPVPSDDTIKERNTLYVAALISLAGKQEEALNDARGALKNVSIFDDASETEKAAWASEKKRIEGVLLAAEGYGTFRKAQFFYPDTKTGNKDFAKQCEAALQNLQEADSRQPNQYLLLQDLGIIYGDARYDYRNQKIGVAKRYFERSLKIKPDDYFGYQNLAILAVRQAFASGAQLDSATLDAAITNANKSLESRPSNGTVFVALAQLYALYWSIESDADKKKKWAAAYGSSIENARSAGASASRILAAELQWGLIRLRAAADDPAPTDPPPTTDAKSKAGGFSFEKDEYAKKLDSARQEASRLPGWEARQLTSVIDDLKTKLAAATSDKRAGLIWPPAPISPTNDDP